ncbi:MAG: GlsB/YeaQ/YmgE family stress response membrane protein [Candidatus Saccharimonadales bacterium]
MGPIGWIVLGGLAGWIASKFAGTDKDQGIVANIIVGILGAVIGGWLFGFFGGSGVSGFNIWSFFVAVVGAVILLAVLKAFRK